MSFYLASASGWMSAVLAAITITLPYAFRRAAPASQIRALGPFLLRMRPHYWLGYIIVGLSLVHASVSMNRATLSTTSMAGLVFATGALLLLFCQVILGLNLNQPTHGRRTLRRWHFAVMLGIAVLGLSHIVLNSVLLRVLFR